MKKANYSYVGISFIILLFGIIFVPRIVDRVKNNDITRDESRSNTVSTTKKQSDLAFLKVNGKPKKVPVFSFTDQNGKTITNKDYEGKVYVVEFFFTTCPTICPLMNRNMVAIQNTFKDFKDFGVASFTINPAYDTPEILKTYAKQYGVTNPNWHFLTGNQDAIMKLSNEGFNLFADENPEVEGGFEHSGNFALIDKNGYVRSRTDAYGNPIIFYNGIISEEQGKDDDGKLQEITMLKQDIKKLLQE